MSLPVNPYCSCDPCECEPLCLCRLTLVRRYTDTEWDDRTDELVHAVVERYAPVAGAARATPAPMAPELRHSEQTIAHHANDPSLADHQDHKTHSKVSSPVPDAPGGINHAIAAMRAGEYDVTGGLAPTDHDDHSVSVRSAEHNGHTIRIETTYRILIDDEVFPDPIHVQDDGSVHYHGLPQYSTASAVDLLKVVVDNMSDADLPPLIGGPLIKGPLPGPDGHHHPDGAV